MDNVNTELKELTLCDQLRANSSFMKIMATLFHYGNQPMNAAQLVVAVRALDLLPLRGETPKSTIQGIISTSRKTARDLKKPDPFEIQKDSSGRQARYCISQSVLGDATVPPPLEIPDEPIILKPVEHATSYSSSYAGQLGKRQRKTPKFYTPDALRKASRRRKAAKKRRQGGYGGSDDGSDVDVDMEDDSDLGSVGSSDEESVESAPVEEDTINHYSLLYAPPTADMNYIDSINFEEYPIASYFAIAQQKGYSYPRFRSHEKVKIPKVHCEDKFRVADIVSPSEKRVVGRMFILADGHGGRGCSEFFVRKTPAALQELCANYNIDTFADKETQKRFEKDIKHMVEALDEQYLEIKRLQLGRIAQNGGEDDVKTNQTDDNNKDQKQQEENNAASDSQGSEEKDNDGCTLIVNIFLGNWLINVNVGDSRSVLISAPEPASADSKPSPSTLNDIGPLGLDSDYKMDVVFASQDHKPYLEHLAREILENGGEFVDSVQDRVIKVDLDKLREDGNRQAKRIALKNARIRPKDYTPHEDDTKTNNSFIRPRTRDSRIPSLNVARSCGDLDFKMNKEKKIISCEPDVTFIRISDDDSADQRTLVTSGPHKSKRRHFLFMSTDGMFDYMYEDTPERQNRAVARMMGPMIEDGEKSGGLMLQNEENSGGQTIDHTQDAEKKQEQQETMQENGEQSKPEEKESIKDEEDRKDGMDVDKPQEAAESDSSLQVKNNSTETSEEKKVEETKAEGVEQPRVPLLFRELNEEETRTRKIKERTLAMAARYFANREGLHGFFASTLQDYDDCTIVLIEI